jgi:hypothetical protein
LNAVSRDQNQSLQKSSEKSADWLSRTGQQTIQLKAATSQRHTGFDRCWHALRNAQTK